MLVTIPKIKPIKSPFLFIIRDVMKEETNKLKAPRIVVICDIKFEEMLQYKTNKLNAANKITRIPIANKAPIKVVFKICFIFNFSKTKPPLKIF